MKKVKLIAIGILLVLGISGASAQSLGDYARSVRKNKTEPTTASRHYDNDNLPTNETLSVVGPPPGSDANANSTPAPSAPASNAAADRQKAADEWKQKIDKQKEKVDALNHELDLDQRELRMRSAAVAADPGLLVRNVDFDKQNEQYKNDAIAKQKALDAARQQLDDLQDQAHKAGVAENDTDKNNDKEKDKDKDNNNNKDQ